MKQVLEDLRDGRIFVEEVPAPQIRDGFVLVQNLCSLISSGTEGSSVKLGQMNLVSKAFARPDQAMKVFQVARTQGLLTAYQVAQRALEMPLALGYSSAGRVLAVGRGVDHVRINSLVACAGQGFASHAEVVRVPKHLCVAVPAEVDAEQAAFSTVGAIALQSLRVADVRLGDNVVVIGLGLVGLLTVQLLRAAGCRVFGIDISPERLQWVKDRNWADVCSVDAPNINERVLEWSQGLGADAIVVTAATDDAGPVTLAGELVRRKGKVVVVGRTEMRLPREQFLFKELELRTSMAYGPGTGDPAYELDGHDYPLAYVRWTEQRNMQAFLDQIASGAIDVRAVVTHRFDVSAAAEAFALISGKHKASSIGILLHYPDNESDTTKSSVRIATHRALTARTTSDARCRISVIGAGSHATNEFLPLLASHKLTLHGVASMTGVRATVLAKKYGFAYAASDANELITDADTDAICILTRHDTHADFAAQALAHGKHVFVEKPLALTLAQLQSVRSAHESSGRVLMVGFNRRFAPLALSLREQFASRVQPMSLMYCANVGYRPPEHWLHHPLQGGGVVLGEACHHVDFCCWIIGAPVVDFDVRSLGGSGAGYLREDNVHITLSFQDGSLAQLQYLSNGAKAFPTEVIEASCENLSARLTDFRLLETGRGLRRSTQRLWRSSTKGQDQQLNAFLSAVHDPTKVDSHSYFDSSELVIAINDRLAQYLVLGAGDHIVKV